MWLVNMEVAISGGFSQLTCLVNKLSHKKRIAIKIEKINKIISLKAGQIRHVSHTVVDKDK